MFTLSVYITHIASNSLVSKFSKIVLTFFMMSEARWTADENIVFFSRRSIVIEVTPIIFWLKCKNLPKCTKFFSTRKVEVAAKNFGLLTKNMSHALANTGA